MRFLALICLLAVVSTSFAIRCYSTAKIYGRQPLPRDAIDCPSDVKACLGAVYQGKVDGINQHTSAWTCDYQHQYVADDCTTTFEGDLKQTVCFCHTDLCNPIANV